VDLDRVLVDLRAQVELIDATIVSLERLAEFDRRMRERRRSGRRRVEPLRRRRRERLGSPRKAMGAGSESV